MVRFLPLAFGFPSPSLFDGAKIQSIFDTTKFPAVFFHFSSHFSLFLSLLTSKLTKNTKIFNLSDLKSLENLTKNLWCFAHFDRQSAAQKNYGSIEPTRSEIFVFFNAEAQRSDDFRVHCS